MYVRVFLLSCTIAPTYYLLIVPTALTSNLFSGLSLTLMTTARFSLNADMCILL